jgi:hypothetical protein
VKSLYLIKHNAMKTYQGMEAEAPPFLALALDGNEWSASHPSHFTTGERASIPIE